MRKFLQRVRREQEGVLALEAMIGMLLFLMMMLALYSLIIVFMAQSMIGHALSQCSQSMAMEGYATTKIEAQVSTGGLVDYLVQLISKSRSNGSHAATGDNEPDREYTRTDQWHLTSSPVPEVARRRFASYLAGGEAAADEYLENLGIDNGLDGMDFSESVVLGGDLIIKVSYKIKPLIRLEMYSFGEFDSSQSVRARMWG